VSGRRKWIFQEPEDGLEGTENRESECSETFRVSLLSLPKIKSEGSQTIADFCKLSDPTLV